MPWTLTEKQNHIVLTMNSNKVNAINPNFFKDFHEAFDELDQKHPLKPVILTSHSNKVFSAGIDFEYSFDLFKTQDVKKVWDWFKDYNKMYFRLFTAERMTIAAVNGHIYAGGLILALCCDFRIGLQGNSRYSLNEVPIGIPMPSAFTEIIRHRLGNDMASETILLGKVYSPKEALDKRFIQNLAHSVPDLQVMSSDVAESIKPNSWRAYAQSKLALNFEVMQKIEAHSLAFDKDKTCAVITHTDSLKAQEETHKLLKIKTGKL